MTAIALMLNNDARYQQALEAAGLSAFELNLRTNQMWLSANAAVVMHLNGPVTDWRRHIHPSSQGNMKILIAGLSINGTRRLNEVFQVEAPGAGTPVWVEVNGEVQDEPDQAGLVLRGTLRNVTNAKLDEEALQESAGHDPATGLLNRVAFEQSVAQAIKNSPLRPSTFMLIEISDFQDLGRVHGRLNLDSILSAAGSRITNATRNLPGGQPIIGRIARSQFGVFIPGFGDSREEDQVQAATERLARALNSSYPIDGHNVPVRAHTGVSYYPVDGMNTQDLIENARLAVEVARVESIETDEFWALYTIQMRRDFEQRSSLAQRIPSAIRAGEFELFYQPIRCLEDNSIISVEMLPRWNLDGKVLTPGVFIPVAEKYGHMRELGDWLMDRAIAQLAEWDAKGNKELKISINLARYQLLDWTPMRFEEIIGRYPSISPDRIIFDVRSGDLNNDNREKAVRKLNALAALGCEIHIDDYGMQTGYDTELQISALKIIPAYVRNIISSSELTQLLVRLSKERNYKVIAKGVETPDQKQALIQTQCQYGQGNYLGAPQRAEEIESQLFIETNNAVFVDFQMRRRR